jgi:hypothetical protein
MLEEGDAVDGRAFGALGGHSEFRRARQKAYYEVLRASGLVPLDTLVGCLRNPCKLIEKRNDKLVDYEAILSDVKAKSMQQVAVSKEVSEC